MKVEVIQQNLFRPFKIILTIENQEEKDAIGELTCNAHAIDMMVCDRTQANKEISSMVIAKFYSHI